MPIDTVSTIPLNRKAIIEQLSKRRTTAWYSSTSAATASSSSLPIDRRRRPRRFTVPVDSDKTTGLIVLTLSPHDGNKLTLKYENIDQVKLSPDNVSTTTAVEAATTTTRSTSTAMTLGNDRRRGKLPTRYFGIALQNHRQDRLRDIFEPLRVAFYGDDEMRSLTNKKTVLEQYLDAERHKNEILKKYNENLKYALLVLTTKTLELAIDKRKLEDEMQNIVWRWKCKFLWPCWSKAAIFYRKL